MYEVLYPSNYFANFFISSIFLSIIVIFSFLLSSKLEKNNIKIFKNYLPIVIFFLVFLCFTLSFNILLLSEKFKFYRIFVYIVSAIVIFFIIINKNYITIFFKKIKNIKLKLNEKIILLLLFFFYLISILPISDADSIALHQYFASYVFLNGLSDLDISKFFEFSLFTNSEILLLFSPILKSDNFGAQLNLITIIIFFILPIKNKNSFFLFLISCPLIIFFISTQKLQLFFGILFLILFILVHKKIIKSKLEIFVFILLLLFYISGKLSYIFIAGPLFIYFLIIYNKYFKFILMSSLICFFLTLFPILLMKYYYFGNPFAPFFDDIFNSSREIMNAFALSVRSSEGWLLNPNDFKIYIKPFFPTSIGTLSSSLGILFIFFLLNFSLLKKLKFYPIIIIILIISTGQILPRYYFEAFLILAFFYEYKNHILLNFLIYTQLFLVLVFSTGFILISYIDLGVAFNKEKYMKRFSYSFFNSKEYKKLNIHENILAFSQDRSSLFIKKNIHPTRYINSMNLINDNKQKIVIDYINRNEISYIITSNIKDLPSCLSVNKVNDIYQKLSIRNFLVINKKNKYEVYKIINNKCNL